MGMRKIRLPHRAKAPMIWSRLIQVTVPWQPWTHRYTPLTRILRTRRLALAVFLFTYSLFILITISLWLVLALPNHHLFLFILNLYSLLSFSCNNFSFYSSSPFSTLTPSSFSSFPFSVQQLHIIPPHQLSAFSRLPLFHVCFSQPHHSAILSALHFEVSSLLITTLKINSSYPILSLPHLTNSESPKTTATPATTNFSSLIANRDGLTREEERRCGQVTQLLLEVMKGEELTKHPSMTISSANLAISPFLPFPSSRNSRNLHLRSTISLVSINRKL